MGKYFNYIGKLTFKLLAKSVIYIGILLFIIGIYTLSLGTIILGSIIILWMIIAYKCRSFSRSIIYSYTLDNNIYLPRLTENGVNKVGNVWKIGKTGEVQDKKVSWFEYQFVYWFLWGWVDDACDRDTVPIGYGEDILEGKHFSWFPTWLLNIIKKEQKYLANSLAGESFHLGDKRTKIYVPILSTLWMFRNLAYNFNYSMEEIREDDKNNFYIKLPKLKWHFGYIPYSNSVRKGRLVYFSEDYDKLDEEATK